MTATSDIPVSTRITQRFPLPALIALALIALTAVTLGRFSALPP